jgi:Lar family restriction alleviation protein
MNQPTPCPFCGEHFYLRHMMQDGGRTIDLLTNVATSVDRIYSMVCRNCGARGPETTHADKAVAVVRWNDRSE